MIKCASVFLPLVETSPDKRFTLNREIDLLKITAKRIQKIIRQYCSEKMAVI